MLRLRGGENTVASLLCFTAGFIDMVGFLGMHALLPSLITGNFLTLGTAILLGGHGILAKALAVPFFILIVALTRLGGRALARRRWPELRSLLCLELALLACFAVLAIGHGRFDGTTPWQELAISAFAVAAMAMQTAIYRMHLGALPPTTLITLSVTQATIDAVDLATEPGARETDARRARMIRLGLSVTCFAAGCAVAAPLFAWGGFWCLLVPVAVSAATALVELDRAEG
jgi:uncharacterized membrane protein YoaK (UPF0700 family)